MRHDDDNDDSREQPPPPSSSSSVLSACMMSETSASESSPNGLSPPLPPPSGVATTRTSPEAVAAIAAVAFASPANISSPASRLPCRLVDFAPNPVGVDSAAPTLSSAEPIAPPPGAAEIPPPSPAAAPALPPSWNNKAPWPARPLRLPTPRISSRAAPASQAAAGGGRDLRSSHRLLRKERKADLSAASSRSAASPLSSEVLAILAEASLARLRPLHLASAPARQRWLESLKFPYSSRTERSWCFCVFFFVFLRVFGEEFGERDWIGLVGGGGKSE